MRNLINILVYVLALSGLVSTPLHAGPYHLIVGNSTLGLLENEKQNVNLGFNSAFNELLTSENVRCDFITYDSSAALALAIQNNQVNAFFGSPMEFLGSEQFLIAKPMVSGIVNKKLKGRVFLVARKESNINTLQQLKGARFSAQKLAIDDVGGLFLETLLLENKLPPAKKLFLEVKEVDTSNQALIDLFFKKTDVTLVGETEFEIAAELNPQLRLQTKVIAASEPYLIFVTAARKGLPAEEFNSIKNALLNVNNTAKGRKVLSLMKVDGFQEVSLNDLENVRALISKHQRLKAEADAH